MDDFYLKCFWDLCSTRHFEFGPIPWDCIVNYGYHVGLERDIIDAFVAILRAMDAGYIGWAVEQAERDRQQKMNRLGKRKTQ